MGGYSRSWRNGNPEDLPYGPGNPDYEYDAERQRRDEEDSGQQQADNDQRRADEEQSHQQ